MLGGFIRAEVKQLFVINQTDTQVIEESDASDHIDRKIFRFGEVDGRLPFQITYRQCDFVAVGGERTSGGANAFGDAAEKIKVEFCGETRLEGAKFAARVELGVRGS
jgi:hypothetical protein